MEDNNEDIRLTHRESVTLRSYFDAQLAALERLLCVKILALEKEVNVRLSELMRAIDLAAAGLKERLAGMNEIREQLDRQARSFATIIEMNGIRAILEAKIESLTKSRDELEIKVNWTTENLATVRSKQESLVTSRDALEVKVTQLTKDMSEVITKQASLESSRDEAKGKASQWSVILSTALAIGGLLVGIVSLFIKLGGG